MAFPSIPPRGLDQQFLKEVLHYEPDTGVWKWLQRTSPRVAVGTVAGSIDQARHGGYVKIFIGNRAYKAHRLAFLYMTGAWPTGPVDHINHQRADNRWSNLREATASENGGNRVRSRNNRSGVKGVHVDPTKAGVPRYIATIYGDGRNHYLGTFNTLEEARVAYAEAAVKRYGSFACHD